MAKSKTENIITKNPHYESMRSFYHSNRHKMSLNDMMKDHFKGYFSGKDYKTAKAALKRQAERWDNEIIDTAKAEIEAMNEEELANYTRDTKISSLMFLKSEIDKLRRASVNSEDSPIDHKTLSAVQKTFDSLWKSEIAREDIILKKRKENRHDVLAIFDIYSRFGTPDDGTLEAMRQAVNGNIQRPKPSDERGTVTETLRDAGRDVSADGVSEEPGTSEEVSDTGSSTEGVLLAKDGAIVEGEE